MALLRRYRFLLIGLAASLALLAGASRAGLLPEPLRSMTAQSLGGTSGDIAGGAFSPAPGTVAANASPAVTAAVNAAGVNVVTQLQSGTLTATSPSGATVTIPAPVQATLLAVLTAPTPTATQALTTALEASGASAARELAQSLQNLLSSPPPGQLASAVGLFNAVTNEANPAFLANPPAEFLAVHAVLAQLAAAAKSAQ